MPQPRARPPLDGIRIIAVEQYGAGPFGTTFLTNLGAEVIKIENPHNGGDVSRSLGPYFMDDEEGGDSSLFYQGLNTDKKSLTLDLSRPAAQAVLAALARSADGLVTNLRGDVPAKLGLTYEHLKQHNAALVCAHLTAYGRRGERASWPGYDYMMQAETGYFHLTGEPDSPPMRCGLSIIDFMSGAVMAFALVSALLGARRDGVGRDIDVSLFDVALYNLNYVGLWQLNAGHRQQRVPRSAHFSLTPCQLYRTGDGWIYLMCNKEKFWGQLCDCLARPQWRDDPRLRDFPGRLQHRDQLTAMIDEALADKTTAQWLEVFKGRVPAAPVLDPGQALDNPWLHQNRNLQTVPRGDGSFRTIRNPVRCADETDAPRSAPKLGADTESLLRELGYNAAQIEELKQSGAI